MIAKYQLVSTIIFLLITINKQTEAAAVFNSSDYGLKILEIPQTRSEVQARSVLQINLNSCTCLNQTEECEIAISKSSILEMDCPADKIFCCRETKMIIPPTGISLDTKTEQTAPDQLESPRLIPSDDDPNVKIRLIEDVPEYPQQSDVGMGQDNLTPENNPLGETRSFFSPSLKLNNVETPSPSMEKNKCLCKIRENCPEKYIDYGFGFHCSYDKVHCCGPQNEILEDANSETSSLSPQLITGNQESKININRTTDEDYYEEQEDVEEEVNEIKCYCLPKDECKVTDDENQDNLVWRRQDTLCPGETVQCCGSQVPQGAISITEKLDEDEEESDSKNEDGGSSQQQQPAAVLGQGGFLQPIQLPELKIPVVDDYTEQQKGETTSLTSTLTPPELPTYYNYQPPKYYSGYYYPQIPQAYDRPVPTTPKYNDGYVRYPWSREPSSYLETVPGGHRGISQPLPIEENPRSSPNTSLLDKIANILG